MRQSMVRESETDLSTMIFRSGVGGWLRSACLWGPPMMRSLASAILRLDRKSCAAAVREAFGSNFGGEDDPEAAL
jgi:hypothetical protein